MQKIFEEYLQNIAFSVKLIQNNYCSAIDKMF